MSATKYVIVILSGAADRPSAALGGRTPLQTAHLPALDELARRGRLGTAETHLDDLPPRTEHTLLAALGYEPRRHDVGRARLEALARGIPLGEFDEAFRCNLVSVADERLIDATAGYVSTREAQQLLVDLQTALDDERVRIYPGREHRHLLVWKDAGPLPRLETRPPHEVVGQPLDAGLPRHRTGEALRKLTRWAHQELDRHDVNEVRRELGENPANGIWLSGNGKVDRPPSFHERFGRTGCMIAGTCLAHGIGHLLGWAVPHIPDATGLPDTNLAAKCRAALEAAETHDLVCVQIEGADELGHQGDAERKAAFLERVDSELIAALVDHFEHGPASRLLVLCDRSTPTEAQVHVAEPLPFVMAGRGIASNRGERFDEAEAAAGEMHVPRAADLMEYFIRR